MTNVSSYREPHDFYPTPPEGTRALLSVEQFDGPIWEPACGNGALAEILTAAGHRVVATDLVDRGYGIGGVNFLTETMSRAKHIVTNPPYGRGLADMFIRHALQLTRETGGTVAMLLDLASLAHPIRTPFYAGNPPAVVYVLDQLIFQPAARPVVTAAHSRYCWQVWKPGHTGPSSLRWIATKPFRNRRPRKITRHQHSLFP